MKKDKLLQEALANIREDRDTAADLLVELQKEIVSGDTTHSKSGVVAAKYLETLQRSNEQMVKLISIISKESKSAEDISLSDKEKDSIFDLIKGSA